MSFSLKVKNELAAEVPNSRHCRIAELAALVSLSSTVEDGCIVIRTENSGINERFVLLYGKLTGEAWFSGGGDKYFSPAGFLAMTWRIKPGPTSAGTMDL